MHYQRTKTVLRDTENKLHIKQAKFFPLEEYDRIKKVFSHKREK